MTAPVELVRELLFYRDMRMSSGRDWGLITALVAGTSIAFPVLTPVALASMAGLGIHKLRTFRRRRAIVGIELAPPGLPEGALHMMGRARRFRATVRSLGDGGEVLAEHVAIRNRRGALLLRRTTGAAFWLERLEGEPVLVIGATRRVGDASATSEVRKGDPRLAELGVPRDLAIRGALEIASLRDAAPVSAIGAVAIETIPELAFHRDGGQVAVMRGRPGAPVLLSY